MYQPSETILRKYADLLVKFALNGGKGPLPKQVIQLNVPDCAKPLFEQLLRAVLETGAYPKVNFIPTSTDHILYAHASDDQLTFFPEKFKRSEVDLIDHQVSIISDPNPSELQHIDSKKIFRAMDARKAQREWIFEKELRGAFSWTLALYGTPAMAKEAGLTLEEYWEQIILACFLDKDDPISEWKEIQRQQMRVMKNLNALEIEWVHIEGDKIDLTVQIGEHRHWFGGSCRNIPSFEIFTSPNWRGTSGKIYFNQPLYRYGNILRDITLEFKDGLVVSADAKVGKQVLLSMIERINANKIGEYSLTDRRFSRITKFMANTLFDENIGGRYGNTHLALGRAYKDTFPGDQTTVTKEQWEAWGYNDSPEHTDIISTEDRVVTATLRNGQTMVIFKDGQFVDAVFN
jgi:aminopeptidase